MTDKTNNKKENNLEVITKENARNFIINPISFEEQYRCLHKKRYIKIYREHKKMFGIKREWVYIEDYCVKCRCLAFRLTL